MQRDGVHKRMSAYRGGRDRPWGIDDDNGVRSSGYGGSGSGSGGGGSGGSGSGLNRETSQLGQARRARAAASVVDERLSHEALESGKYSAVQSKHYLISIRGVALSARRSVHGAPHFVFLRLFVHFCLAVIYAVDTIEREATSGTAMKILHDAELETEERLADEKRKEAKVLSFERALYYETRGHCASFVSGVSRALVIRLSTLVMRLVIRSCDAPCDTPCDTLL
jgi:hypothetical protein